MMSGEEEAPGAVEEDVPTGERLYEVRPMRRRGRQLRRRFEPGGAKAGAEQDDGEKTARSHGCPGVGVGASGGGGVLRPATDVGAGGGGVRAVSGGR